MNQCGSECPSRLSERCHVLEPPLNSEWSRFLFLLGIILLVAFLLHHFRNFIRLSIEEKQVDSQVPNVNQTRRENHNNENSGWRSSFNGEEDWDAKSQN